MPANLLLLSTLMIQHQKIDPARRIQAIAGGLHQIRIGPVSEKSSATPSYVFFAPLDDHNRIDARLWKEMRGACRVFKICADDSVRPGTLFHRHGTNWAFQYDGRTVTADDTVISLDNATLEPGQSIWLTDRGVRTEYRIVSVEKIWI